VVDAVGTAPSGRDCGFNDGTTRSPRQTKVPNIGFSEADDG